MWSFSAKFFYFFFFFFLLFSCLSHHGFCWVVSSFHLHFFYFRFHLHVELFDGGGPIFFYQGFFRNIFLLFIFLNYMLIFLFVFSVSWFFYSRILDFWITVRFRAHICCWIYFEIFFLGSCSDALGRFFFLGFDLCMLADFLLCTTLLVFRLSMLLTFTFRSLSLFWVAKFFYSILGSFLCFSPGFWCVFS